MKLRLYPCKNASNRAVKSTSDVSAYVTKRPPISLNGGGPGYEPDSGYHYPNVSTCMYSSNRSNLKRELGRLVGREFVA